MLQRKKISMSSPIVFVDRKPLVFALSVVLICVSIPYSKAAQDHASYCAPLAGASVILLPIFFLALVFNLVPSLLLSLITPFILLPIIILALPFAFMALPIVLLLLWPRQFWQSSCS
jgi:hypothetical protein